MTINQMNLRSLRSPADAVALFGLLGYGAQALPVDAADFGVSANAFRPQKRRQPIPRLRRPGRNAGSQPALSQDVRTQAR